MKRTIVLLATLLLSFGLINAANQADFTLGGLGFTGPDTIWCAEHVELEIWFENDIQMNGYSAPFIMTSDGIGWTWLAQPDGWGPAGYQEAPACVTVVEGSRQYPADDVWDVTELSVTLPDMDGVSPDVFMSGGVANKGGLQPGPLEKQIVWHFQTDAVGEEEEATLCIDSFHVGSSDLVFADELGTTIAMAALWGPEPICYVVKLRPDFCPAWNAGLPVSMNVDHCGSNQVTLSATDPEASPIFFALAGVTGGAGTAIVTDNGNGTMTLTYSGVAADVGQAISIEVDVYDAAHAQGTCASYTVAVSVTNNAPAVNCGAMINPVGKGNTLVKTDIVGSDLDGCDVLTYSVATLDSPFGAFDINPATGVFTFATLEADAGFVYTFDVTVSDGITTATCSFPVEVLAVEPFEVRIEKTHGTLQGHFVDVAIRLTLGSEALGGFDFLIAYDPTTLTFTEANMGPYFSGCGWEFFTYRYGDHGNCGNACPSGEVRLIGIAETNNGPYHPDFECIKLAPATDEILATMTFFVTNDYNVGGLYLPIKFFWMDCGDNTMSVFSGDTLAVSRFVYEYYGSGGVDTWVDISDPTWGFPGIYGAPDFCLVGDKVTPIRFVDFYNGGVDVIPPDEIDARGDINCNGLANEIADAVMFTNYFISGLSAFGDHVEASIAASDINADGLALSVADLVYQVRIIIGDALPYPKPVPGAYANFELSQDNGMAQVTVEASDAIGAALFVFSVNGTAGTPVAVDAAAGMKVVSDGSNGELRVLVYDIGSSRIASEGTVLNIPVNGTLTLESVEAGAYDGYVMESTAKTLPTEFSLLQNYPNPFNPATSVMFTLKTASDWNLNVYNVAGQLVRNFTGYSEAGTQTVVWDGNDNNGASVASGIYFYKLTAGDFTATKKMVLMK